MDERGFRTRPPCGLEQIERPDSVGVKIVERDRGGPIVRRLGCSVYNGIRLEQGDEFKNALAIPDVEFVVGVVLDRMGEALLIPARVALRTKKDRPLVVV